MKTALLRLALLLSPHLASAKNVILPCQIPFYHKCVVPTYPPDAESDDIVDEFTGKVACCSREKRKFPVRAVEGAVGYRLEHLRNPLVELAESLMVEIEWQGYR